MGLVKHIACLHVEDKMQSSSVASEKIFEKMIGKLHKAKFIMLK